MTLPFKYIMPFNTLCRDTENHIFGIWEENEKAQ